MYLNSAPAHPSLGKAAIAGALGGLAGSAAKVLAETVTPRRPDGQTPPPAVLVEQVEGRALARADQQTASPAIHWVFGTGLGVLYGIAAEYFPQTAARGGAEFGVMLWTLAHEAASPALRLTPPLSRMSIYEQGTELSTHAIYGLVTEFVRRSVRERLP